MFWAPVPVRPSLGILKQRGFIRPSLSDYRGTRKEVYSHADYLCSEPDGGMTQDTHTPLKADGERQVQ
jgi:hypothetical protein